MQKDYTITGQVIAAAIEVHRELGPGLLESAYEACLAAELTARNLPFARQVALPVRYKGAQVDCGYRLDMVVDGSVLVELKSVEEIAPIHHAQVLSYMKLANLQTGLLLNFNVYRLVDGIHRFVL